MEVQENEIITFFKYEIESIIQQNVFVFNAMLKDNITMFRDFSEEQINEAIRLSSLSALIEEKGADYLCDENGSGLSGGEKQRVSIARSLLKQYDSIITLKNGSIVEVGTFEELIAKKGYFYSLFTISQ